jgi:Caspase domain
MSGCGLRRTPVKKAVSPVKVLLRERLSLAWATRSALPEPGFLMRAVAILVLTVWSLWLSGQPALAGKRVALVIGNSAYQHVIKLSNPANDSESVSVTLKAAGFDVVDLQRDLGIDEMRKVLRDFSDKSSDADVAVVYYAGHGMELDGTNYIIPVDAVLKRDIDVYDEAISLDRILAVIEPARQLRLVILDACRDNPFAGSMKRTVGRRAIGRGLAKVEPTTPNTMIAFAAKAGSTALDGDSKHSPFTASLVKYIARPGLDLRRAFGYIRDDVLKNTGNRQEPFVYGSLGGDDVPLVPAKPVATAAAHDPSANIRRDYELALQIGNRAAWKIFLERYHDGFYAKLAQVQLAKIAAEEARVAATEKARLAAEQKARLAAQGAKRADQDKAAAAAKGAEEARLAAEKRSQIEQAKAAAAEQERSKAEAHAAQEQAKLGATSKLPAQSTPEELSQNIQSELRRVGCFRGSASREWTAAARQSLVRFNRSTGLALDVKTASLDTLEAIRKRSTRVCPLVCEHGFRPDGERCVRIVCKSGSVLNDDNECERKRARPTHQANPKPTKHERGKETSSTPQASDPSSRKEICRQKCQDARVLCNKKRGGYFNGCLIQANACVAGCY